MAKKKKELSEISYVSKDFDPIAAAKRVEDYLAKRENFKEMPPKPKPVIKCPLCKSTDIDDNSTYSSNGVFGPGYRSHKTSDSRCCNKCGIIFKPVKGNGLEDEE